MIEFKDRIAVLQGYCKEDEAFLITNEVNIFYYTALENSEGTLLITKNEAYFLVDFRYGETAKNKSSHTKVIVYTNLINEISNIIENEQIKSINVEVNSMTISRLMSFENSINAEFVKDGKLDSYIKKQRIIKSEFEIKQLRKAQQITEKAYLQVLNYLKVGVKEKDISNELLYLIKKYGGDKESFDLITITGKKTSLPHGVPGDEQISDGDFFTFDIGTTYCGYHSDMTRTVAIKSATDNMIDVYNTVLDAQLKALNTVKAGVSAQAVDMAARNFIADKGYGDCFGHATGHGVGLDIHEAPVASSKSKYILKENMTLTIEPGIYLPNKYGVRIEDTVIVKKDGYENLVSLPKELIII